MQHRSSCRVVHAVCVARPARRSTAGVSPLPSRIDSLISSEHTLHVVVSCGSNGIREATVTRGAVGSRALVLLLLLRDVMVLIRSENIRPARRKQRLLERECLRSLRQRER